MTDKSWRIDFARLAVLTLPTFLRKPVIARYSRVMATGVAKTHSQLVEYRDSISYELSMTGQVCRLRALLNDAFDAVQRRITVVDVEQAPSATVVWLRADRRGLAIAMRDNGGGLAISCRGYEGIKQPDFEVIVPARVVVDDRRLSALVNSHKLAGKRYKLTKLI